MGQTSTGRKEHAIHSSRFIKYLCGKSKIIEEPACIEAEAVDHTETSTSNQAIWGGRAYTLAASAVTQAVVQQRLSGFIAVARQLVQSATVEVYAPQYRWIVPEQSGLLPAERAHVECLADHVMSTGEIICIADVKELPKPRYGVSEFPGIEPETPLHFFGGFPISSPPKILGVLMVITRSQCAMTPEQQQAIAVLANEIGGLLAAANLHAAAPQTGATALPPLPVAAPSEPDPLISSGYHKVMRLSMALQSCLSFEDLNNRLIALLPANLPIHAFEVALHLENHTSQQLCVWSDDTVSIPSNDELVCQIPTQLDVYAQQFSHGASSRVRKSWGQDSKTDAIPADAAQWRCYQLTVQHHTLGTLKFYLKSEAATVLPMDNSILDYVADQIGVTLSRLVLLRKLQTENLQDPLTKLFNRRHMMNVLSQLLKRVSYGRYQVGLIMLDLDHFKHLNDTYGHDAGDQVLSMVGLFLKGHARPNDVVCRFGGEEFLLILPGVTWQILERRARQVCRGMHYLNIKIGETPLQVTLSAGFAIAPQHAETPAMLIKAADTALHEAKCQGRDSAVGAPLSSESKS